MHTKTVFFEPTENCPETNASVLKNYYLLEPWAARFKELNPHSACIVEWDTNHVFQRLFIPHGAFVEVLRHSSQSIAMEDCAFMKAANYNGQFMVMSSVDGNLNNVLIAAALVPAEQTQHYKWFFNNINSYAGDVLEKLKNRNLRTSVTETRVWAPH